VSSERLPVIREKPTSLLLLYGTLEYDGRAQRLLEVLQSLGDIFVVDVAVQGETMEPIVSVPRFSVRFGSRTGKLRRHFRFWRAALIESWRRRPTVIVSADYFPTLPAWLASKLTGALLIYDAHELIIPEPGGSMSWRDRFWYWMERLAVRRAELIITANEERAQLMQNHYRLTRPPVVMQNIPPMKSVSEEEKKIVLARYPKLVRRYPDERLILYQGNVDLSRGIDRFVQALGYLPAEYRLIVVGGGPDLERLQKIGKPFEREGRLTMLGRVEHRLLPAITAMADVGIVTYPFRGLNNIYCSPNKLFEYAQAGLPVVATNQPPLRRLVEGYGIGKLISEHDTSERIAEAIKEVAEKKDQYAKALIRFLGDHRWEDEAERVRTAILCTLTELRGTA